MASKVYNLMWVRPTFAAEDEIFAEPIPPETVDNIKNIAERNQGVDIKLWIDSKRLTAAQMEWLKGLEYGNLAIADLRDISEYNSDKFFNKPDTNKYWRTQKNSLIWRIVDTARILVCLQGDYSQVFYSDADVINLNVEHESVQELMNNGGILLNGHGNEQDNYYFENQAFGFCANLRPHFIKLYATTFLRAKFRQTNGYDDFLLFIRNLKRIGIDPRRVMFIAEFDGTQFESQSMQGALER